MIDMRHGKLWCSDGEPVGFKAWSFPGGEQHVRIEKSWEVDGRHVSVRSPLRSSDDIMQLALVADAIRAAGGTPHAFIPYMPYARQDRVASPGDPHSLRVFTKMLATCGFESIETFWPHSDVVEALVPGIHINRGRHFLVWVLRQLSGLTVVSPDAGSLKKIMAIYDGEIIVGSKMRDPETGRLSKASFVGDVAGKSLLIVDDICDGGATFIELAKVLRAGGAREVFLAVAHGIFSKGIDVLLEHLDGVYTTDSIYDGRYPGLVETYAL